MRRELIIAPAILLAAGLLISACNSPTEPVQDELTVMKSMIESDPLYTTDVDVLNDDTPVNFAKEATPILPRGWGRKIISVSRTITFDQVTDSVVVATVEHKFIGEIKILAKYSPSDTTFTIITKPDTELTTRKIKFSRIARTTRPRDNWRPREVSAVRGGTTNALLDINQMVVYIGPDTLTINDPLTYFFRLPLFVGRQIPSISPVAQIKVQVTVTSSDVDTDFVFLHRPIMWMTATRVKPLMARMTLVSQTGSGPYSRVYEIAWTGNILGWHHFFVGAITRSSIFDDAAPWATRLWGVPYIVQ